MLFYLLLWLFALVFAVCLLVHCCLGVWTCIGNLVVVWFAGMLIGSCCVLIVGFGFCYSVLVLLCYCGCLVVYSGIAHDCCLVVYSGIVWVGLFSGRRGLLRLLCVLLWRWFGLMGWAWFAGFRLGVACSVWCPMSSCGFVLVVCFGLIVAVVF